MPCLPARLFSPEFQKAGPLAGRDPGRAGRHRQFPSGKAEKRPACSRSVAAAPIFRLQKAARRNHMGLVVSPGRDFAELGNAVNGAGDAPIFSRAKAYPLTKRRKLDGKKRSM